MSKPRQPIRTVYWAADYCVVLIGKSLEYKVPKPVGEAIDALNLKLKRLEDEAKVCAA